MAEDFFLFNTFNSSNSSSQNGSISTTVTQANSTLNLGSKIFLGIIMVLGIVIGTFGNILVPTVVYFNTDMRTVMYTFIINLSIADCMITAIFMPILFGFYFTTYPIWPYHPIVCNLTGYLVHMSVLASGLSFLAISYHRYFGIVHSIRREGISVRTAKIISILIWVFSGTIMLPSAIMYKTPEEIVKGVLVKKCKEGVWPTKFLADAYLVFRITCYLLFILQISVLFTRIACFVRSQKIPGEHETTTRQIHAQRRRKVTKVLFTAVCVYIFCWILYFLNKLFIVVWDNYVPNGIFAVTGSFMGMLNSSFNPYIYFLGHQYRTAARKVLRFKSKTVRSNNKKDQKQGNLAETSDNGLRLVKYEHFTSVLSIDTFTVDIHKES